MWAILGNGSDQMFKLDLQRDSLGRTHRQHSQILWANSFTFHTMFYENRSGLIFDFLTFVLGKQVMKSMSVTWPIPVRTSPSSCCWCISMNFLIEPSDTLSDLGGINCPSRLYVQLKVQEIGDSCRCTLYISPLLVKKIQIGFLWKETNYISFSDLSLSMRHFQICL